MQRVFRMNGLCSTIIYLQFDNQDFIYVKLFNGVTQYIYLVYSILGKKQFIFYKKKCLAKVSIQVENFGNAQMSDELHIGPEITFVYQFKWL